MLTMEDIIRDGHPTLRKVAAEVQLPPSEEDKKILKSLLEYVQNSQNTEIAADTVYGQELVWQHRKLMFQNG